MRAKNIARGALVRTETAVRLPAGFVIPGRQLQAAQRYLAASRAANTRVARESDWRVFTAWCSEQRRAPLPARADTVFSFVLDQVELLQRKPATVARYLASISVAHKGAGHESPTGDARIAELLAGVRRTVGVAQRLAAPLTKDMLEQIKPHVSARDWAVLCFGQALAARRSELCALDCPDVAYESRGAVVTFRQSKTDQERRGEIVAVPRGEGEFCPVAALENYVGRRREGPLFLAARGGRLGVKEVYRAVKDAVAAIGGDPSKYSGHSLRAGYVTDARRAGVPWATIMEHTRHKDLKVARGYARYDRDPFTPEGER